MTWLRSRLWARLNLVTRLSLVVALSIILVAIGAVFHSARHIAAETQDDLTVEYNEQMDTLESVVLSALLMESKTGQGLDWERLKVLLVNYKYGLDVTKISFRDTSDEALFSRDFTIILEAPFFFSRWCGLEGIIVTRPIIVEGLYYGLVSLSMSPNRTINQAWQRYLHMVQILFISLTIILCSIFVVLRRFLRPLQSLAEASKLIAKGDMSPRLQIVGCPELRTVLSNFNQMASSIQATLEALVVSEQRFRVLVEQAPDAILVWDVDLDIIVDTNPCAEKLLGCSHETLLQSSINVFLPPGAGPQPVDEGSREHSDWEQVLKGATSRFERVICKLNGDEVLCEVCMVRLPDSNRNLIRCSLIDITERESAQLEQEKLQAQLNQSQKMESVGRLAGGVAHDFNNMLSVILGYSELALDEVNLSDSLHKDLRAIYDAAKRSADITRQLLAFARKQTVAPKVLDINETIDGMLKMLRRLIGEDIDLAWLLGTRLEPVQIDPSQIDQLLANLCVNARDAITGVGKVTIETGMVDIDEAYCADHAGFIPGEFMLLSVSDDGCGMGHDIVDKIFEPFFTTKEVGQGTGLGLSTVYGIVKQNNGFINVYSEPGHGTTFRIYLPLYKGEVEEISAKATQEVLSGHGETVLVVEDEVAILQLAQTMLERLGYTVLVANTPGEAVRLAKSHAGEIHLLITDVVMPEMNGRDLSGQLQMLHPGIKTLFMSGYTANVIAHRGILDEGVCFMQKPFSANDLAAKIRTAFDHS